MALIVRTTIVPLGIHGGKFTIALHGVTGSWIPSLQNQGDEWQRIGQAGSGVQVVGTRGRKVNVTGWFGAPDFTTAGTFIANFESLETEVCQVSDAWNRTVGRVRISAIQCAPRSTVGPLVSPGSPVKYRVECEWTAERLPDA